MYRRFTKQNLYFDAHFDERRYQMPSILPTPVSETENRLICVNDIAARSPFSALIVANIPDLHICSSDRFQCFPFYTYAEDGTHRRENITDWALEQFRSHYHDPSIIKWDIFHYIYAVLHHPEYRERYAANLRRELPRIPFASATGAKALEKAPDDAALKRRSSTAAPKNDGANINVGARVNVGANSDDGATVEERPFRAALTSKKSRASAPEGTSAADVSAAKDVDVFRALAKAGQRLAEIHVHYEQQPEYKLTKREKNGEKLNWHVTRMRLSKDKTTLTYNEFLTSPKSRKKPTTTASATAPPSNGSSINIRSQPTNAAASPMIPTAPTTPNTSSA